jgi:uncharacterized membrane-anchored protein YitT (DUF2179 family)
VTRRQIDTVIVLLVIGGALLGIGLVFWLVHHKAEGGSIAAVSTLVGLLLNFTGNIVRNRFPGPEIDVVPPGYGAPGGGATCPCPNCQGGS